MTTRSLTFNRQVEACCQRAQHEKYGRCYGVDVTACGGAAETQAEGAAPATAVSCILPFAPSDGAAAVIVGGTAASCGATVGVAKAGASSRRWRRRC